MRLQTGSIFLSIIFIALTSTPCHSLDRLIVVTGDRVNIRVEPNTSSTIVTQAQEGDIFKLSTKRGTWYEIYMFGGDYRYIHASFAKETAEEPVMPTSEEQRRRIFVEIDRAQDRAVKESEQRFPNDFMKQIDYERLLYDRYELEILHRYRMAPALHTELFMEGIRKKWVPPPA